MGPCELTDLEADELAMANARDARFRDGRGHVVKVQRCRFLEEAGCAAVCVNACKMPTQQFFNEDMGVPMRMVPDYETLECRFEFGVAPTAADEAEARSAPCFGACPMAGADVALRCVGMGGDDDGASTAAEELVATLDEEEVVRLWRELSWR